MVRRKMSSKADRGGGVGRNFAEVERFADVAMIAGRGGRGPSHCQDFSAILPGRANRSHLARLSRVTVFFCITLGKSLQNA